MIKEYPNLTECLSTDVFPDGSIGFPVRDNGWFLKHVDTGQMHHRISGEWVDWGLGFSFAPPTKSGRVTTGGDSHATITFVEPFFDDKYSVALTCHEKPGYAPVAVVTERSKDGFTLMTINPKNSQPLRNILVNWLATRDFNG